MNVLLGHLFEGLGPLMQVLFLVGGILSGLLALAIAWKTNRAHGVLRRAAIQDRAWLKNHLEIQARNIFYKVQHAWDARDVASLTSECTSTFMDYFKNKLERRKIIHDKLDIGYIDISNTQIVGCEDHVDNSKDKYCVILTGHIRLHHAGGSRDPIDSAFTEMYHFVRNGERWLLHEISGKPTLLSVLSQPVVIRSIQ